MDKKEIDRVIKCFIDGESGWAYNLTSTGTELISRAGGMTGNQDMVIARRDDGESGCCGFAEPSFKVLYLNDAHSSTRLYKHLMMLHCRLASTQSTFRYFNHDKKLCKQCNTRGCV